MKEQNITSAEINKDKSPTISVIVPVYNVEKLLHRCIDSILAQTFTDFELLLIDDGSPDTSGAICDDYAARDARVRVFHKENGGPSAARNLGLDNAIGEYVTFSDSDDWMENNWLQCMVGAMDGADLVITGHMHHNTKTGIVEQIVLEDGLHTKEECGRICFSLMARRLMGYLWTMMFRNSVFREYNVRFDARIRYQEDLEMILRYVYHAGSIRTVPVSTYHYYWVKKPYEHSLYGISRICDVLRKVLEGELKDKYLCYYAQNSADVLLHHCTKENYYLTGKMLQAAPRLFHGVTITLVRRIVCHIPYCLGGPMIKTIYHIRLLKVRLCGKSPGISMDEW